MYIRFVYETIYDRGLSCGPFTGVNELYKENKLEEYERQLVEEIFEWYKKNLKVPDFQKYPIEAVCWFKESATEHINRMWQFVNILKNHNVPVKVMKSEFPGGIVYSDDLQVVAIAPHYTDCNFKKNLA
jgi:hypothetical protein